MEGNNKSSAWIIFLILGIILIVLGASLIFPYIVSFINNEVDDDFSSVGLPISVFSTIIIIAGISSFIHGSNLKDQTMHLIPEDESYYDDYKYDPNNNSNHDSNYDSNYNSDYSTNYTSAFDPNAEKHANEVANKIFVVITLFCAFLWFGALAFIANIMIQIAGPEMTIVLIPHALVGFIPLVSLYFRLRKKGE